MIFWTIGDAKDQWWRTARKRRGRGWSFAAACFVLLASEGTFASVPGASSAGGGSGALRLLPLMALVGEAVLLVVIGRWSWLVEERIDTKCFSEL